jgi:murein L,D-transpeptidase YcbB/YkuD
MKCTPISVFSGICLALLLLSGAACKSKPKAAQVGQKQVVERPEELKQTVSDILAATLEDARDSNGHNSLALRHPDILDSLYQPSKYGPLWSHDSTWLPSVDSLLGLLRCARYYGLFPDDYGLRRLDSLTSKTRLDTSRATRLDAALWATTDLYLTSALLEFSIDLHVSRMQPDSLRRRSPGLGAGFYGQVFHDFRSVPLDSFTRWLEPKHTAYRDLKTALAGFLEKATFRKYTRINIKDSLHLPEQVRKRLAEDSLRPDKSLPDSMAMAALIKRYQKREGIRPDGKISPELVTRLNMTEEEKFITVAINLDRYKQLPELPEAYIWVNIPTYQLQVFEGDTARLFSKVVVGKPETKTPVLSSAVNNMMSYPQWTIPPSIITKDILPALQRDPGYLARKGFSLLDTNRNEVDPYTVKWSKYKKGIPYKVVQGSGDDNALGVLKFNFPNDYSVYLHDTNQRAFFSRSKRALSHGCVRVESWYSLASYLLRRDSTLLALDSSSKVRAVTLDSLNSWLAQKKRQYIPLRRPMPVYLRYFTVQGKEGKLVFHEDIYGEDRRQRLAWFAKK